MTDVERLISGILALGRVRLDEPPFHTQRNIVKTLHSGGNLNRLTLNVKQLGEESALYNFLYNMTPVGSSGRILKAGLLAYFTTAKITSPRVGLYAAERAMRLEAIRESREGEPIPTGLCDAVARLRLVLTGHTQIESWLEESRASEDRGTRVFAEFIGGMFS